MAETGRPTRRTVLGTGAGLTGTGLLGACSGGAGTPSPAASSATGASASSASTAAPAHDPGWVQAENSLPGDRGWRVRPLAGEELVGYASVSSARPGEPVDVFARSELGPATLTAYRIGHYGGTGGRAVHTSEPLTCPRQPRPRRDERGLIRCDWEPVVTLDTTGWPEGTYLLTLTAGGRGHYIPLTLRSAQTRDRLVVVNATATYQAYNEWGGASLYHGREGGAGPRTFGGRARAVSYDRPYAEGGPGVLLKYEQAPITFAEELGLDLAYVTSTDLDAHPEILDGARGVVSLGHDEYWSIPARQAVEAARDSGTNLAFLGANACYWRTRVEDAGRTLVCTKSADEDPGQGPATTTLWRSAPHPRAENALVGMLYEAFPAVGDLVVHDTGSFLLEGTGAQVGSRYPGLVGSEIDRAYPIPGTPASLQVLAHSPTPLAGGRLTHSDLTHYTAPSGAGVVAVGTMAWAYAINGTHAGLGITRESSRFARQVTATLLTEMAKGPLGPGHPTHPNLDALGVPTSTRTGTGGPVARD